MGFLSGRVTFTRFSIDSLPATFGPEHLEKLEENRFGQQKIANTDGSEIGWIAGTHILDTRFDLAKNIVNNALLFELRIDEQKLPGDLKRAYYLAEVEALGAQNPNGKPTAKQKREARAAAKDRLEEEAKDGRFTKRRLVPILWDGNTNRILVGNASNSVLDRLIPLFKRTFGLELVRMDATSDAEATIPKEDLDSAVLSKFVNGVDSIEWVADDKSLNWLGNEFFLWLWWFTQNVGDTIVTEKDEVTAWLCGSLSLECPRGQFGKETFSGDGPTRLPEARRALQEGRLPRKTGVTLVHHDIPYQFTLQAETMTVQAAKLEKVDNDDERAALEERIDQIRALQDALDRLYRSFLSRRFGSEWPSTVELIKKWLVSV